MSYPRHGRAERASPRDHYAEITEQVIAALEAGILPWRRPWNSVKAGVSPMAPRNAVTGRRYRGINTLLLGMTGLVVAGSDPRWLTYKQAEAKGWQVRRGERGSRVFFFRKLLPSAATSGDERNEEQDSAMRTIPVLRAYVVFHASQIDGLPALEGSAPPDVAWCAPKAAEVIMRGSGATFREGGGRAFYAPATDHIQMPPLAAFESPEAYAATALHELGHWSGAPSRLARDLTGRFGSHAYSQEELRAELASCFIASELGLPCDIPNHASYVASWLRVLKDDKREIFRAAAAAQRIADFLLSFHPEHAKRLAEERDAVADGGGEA